MDTRVAISAQIDGRFFTKDYNSFQSRKGPKDLRFYLQYVPSKKKDMLEIYVLVTDGVSSAFIETGLRLKVSEIVSVLQVNRSDPGLLGELGMPSLDGHLETLAKGTCPHCDITIVRKKDGYYMTLRIFGRNIERKLNTSEFPYEF